VSGHRLSVRLSYQRPKVRIGDYDSDGYRVGYIDPDGLAWESWTDAETCICAARFWDSYSAWRQQKGPRPDPMEVAMTWCSPENVRAGWRRARDESYSTVRLMEDLGGVAAWDPWPLPTWVDPGDSFYG
jgi:hypothetical protein